MEQLFLILEKSNPIAWAFMPQALERIKKFCIKYATETEPEALAKMIQQHFVSDRPLLKVAVVYEKGKGLVSHALAAIDELTGKYYLTIMQFEADVPLKDRKEIKRILHEFKLWAISHGAKEAQLVTTTDAQVRMFERFYGFKKERVVMRKSLLEN